MTLQVASIVKNPNNVDQSFTAPAVDQEVPGRPYKSQVAFGPVAAEEEKKRWYVRNPLANSGL